MEVMEPVIIGQCWVGRMLDPLLKRGAINK